MLETYCFSQVKVCTVVKSRAIIGPVFKSRAILCLIDTLNAWNLARVLLSRKSATFGSCSKLELIRERNVCRVLNLNLAFLFWTLDNPFRTMGRKGTKGKEGNVVVVVAAVVESSNLRKLNLYLQRLLILIVGARLYEKSYLWIRPGHFN